MPHLRPYGQGSIWQHHRLGPEAFVGATAAGASEVLAEAPLTCPAQVITPTNKFPRDLMRFPRNQRQLIVTHQRTHQRSTVAYGDPNHPACEKTILPMEMLFPSSCHKV